MIVKLKDSGFDHGVVDGKMVQDRFRLTRSNSNTVRVELGVNGVCLWVDVNKDELVDAIKAIFPVTPDSITFVYTSVNPGCPPEDA